MFKFPIYIAYSFIISCWLTQKSQPFLAPTKTIFSTASDSIKPVNPVIDSLVFDSLVYFKKNVVASYYHHKLEGKKTASGELYSNAKMTAAHKKFPFGTLLKITNVANSKSVVVKVNDRGPYSKTKEIDLSQAAFLALTGSLSTGQIRVHIQEVK